MECLSTLAALGAATSRVRLGTLVVCNDLRPPAVVAKTAANVDVISGGRLELGVGAGWYEPDFRAAGVPFEPPGVRVSRLAEAVEVISGMLSEPGFSYRGRFYDVDGARTLPRPVQSPPTVWVGGKGDRVVSLAGRLAGGFNTVWAWTPEAYAGRIAVLEGAALAAGRDPGAIRRSVGLYALPGGDRVGVAARWDRYLAAFPGTPPALDLDAWGRDKLCGTPERIAATVGAFAELGVEEIVLCFGLLPFQIADASAVSSFAEHVLPLTR
jgi:alkanesulfonate monooxygenase SsuD/methylene tetrahydromethanopterin reductase-like flavin-dependent oxidoreductase (luciferase family)